MKLLIKVAKNAPVGEWADLMPLVTIAALTGYSLAAISLLVLNMFHGWAVWTLGLLTATLFSTIVVKFGRIERPGSSNIKFICDVVVLVGVIIWGGYNVLFTSQHVLTNRDPATYAVASSWLAEHNSLQIPPPNTLEGVAGVSPRSAGFSLTSDEKQVIQAQGQHLLPALLGALGKVVGPTRILHFNIIFGVTSLFAVYCFARLFLRPQWAVLSVFVLALSMPLLYFSRDTYSEPLALTFTFGGLSFIWIAQKNTSLWLWMLSGLTFATGVLTRIDAYLGLVGLAAFLIVYLALSSDKEYVPRLKQALVLAASTSFVCLLGWLDLSLLSQQYYENTKKLWLLEVLAVLIVVTVGMLIILILKRHQKIIAALNQATIRWRPMAAALFILSSGIFLASRPFWMVSFDPRIPGYHLYEELTTYWVSWYIGPVLACLGLGGVAAVAWKTIQDKTLLHLCGFLIFIGTAAVYFIKPSISPDQIWASRRMLPVIMPGVIVFGTYATMLVYDKAPFLLNRLKYVVFMLVAAALLISPLAASRPLLNMRDTTQYAFIADVCKAIPRNATVLWIGMARWEAVQPTYAYCHVEAYGYRMDIREASSKARLAEIARKVQASGRVPILGVYSYQAGLLGTSEEGDITRVSDVLYSKLTPTHTSPPKDISVVKVGALLASIGDNGTLAPINRQR